MSTSTDTFTEFVDHLASAMADGEAGALDGDDVAARLCFSRFHLDRMIKQVSGEPPATFRRRILLERAAYRLATSATSLIDVAVEAGYSSHEAFTRAFARAYGTAPSQWRRHPGQVRISAPSGVHFHPPGGIRLPARDNVTSMELLTRMVEHHVWLTNEMLTVAQRLTAEQLDEPIELNVDDDPQTIRSLLSRLIGQLGMWNAAMADRAYDWSVEEAESLTSMRARLAVEAPVYLGHVRSVVDEDRLDETFVDALCEPARIFTYGGNIAHVLTFAAHRRTLVALAFLKHGVGDLGWGDPSQWVTSSAG